MATEYTIDDGLVTIVPPEGSNFTKVILPAASFLFALVNKNFGPPAEYNPSATFGAGSQQHTIRIIDTTQNLAEAEAAIEDFLRLLRRESRSI